MINLDEESLDSYKDRKAAKNKALADSRKRSARLQEVENLISELEKLLEELGKSLIDPPDDAGEVVQLGRRYGDTEKALDELLAEWETLHG